MPYIKNSQQHYDKYKRDQEARSFYKSKKWRQCREVILCRDNFLCVDHLKKNQVVAAQMVHHIKELRDYPELAFEPSNLVSLCLSCHEKRHPDRGKRKEKRKKRNLNVVEFEANPEIT
ncbi:endonuclease [Pueribacillus theae]|uniref:Putative HNH nuclease YajD n=1 Tax=Pueribacillus theae TaxID=2171751 RepID=A0A2U1JUZ2_9BACI|nr:HNH endonuclease [Pueribacillus theae]PWA08648.1 endonuclease [Pueribacillus theae]